jgi:hypothetical protein
MFGDDAGAGVSVDAAVHDAMAGVAWSVGRAQSGTGADPVESRACCLGRSLVEHSEASIATTIVKPAASARFTIQVGLKENAGVLGSRGGDGFGGVAVGWPIFH